MKDDESRFEFEVDRQLVGAIAGLFLGVVLVYGGVGGFLNWPNGRQTVAAIVCH